MARIALVIASMDGGGAQRVCSYLARHFAGQGMTVGLVTFSDRDERPFFPISDQIEHVPLGRHPYGGKLHRLVRIGRWVGALRKAIVDFNPDVVLSFIDVTNIMVLLATRGLGIPVIVAERIDPAGYAHRLPKFVHNLRQRTYPWADRVLVQSSRAADWFAGISSRITVLPNPVPESGLLAAPETPAANGRFRVIGIARLDHQKGFDLLIPAFGELARRHPLWDLDIYGKGDEQARLQAMIDASGLATRIRLRGVTPQALREMASSHILAFPSRYEGFPNALAEGMTVGLPVVAMRDVSGVEELVLPDRTGLLFGPYAQSVHRARTRTEVVADLAAGLDRLMSDPVLRQRLGEAGRQHVRRFSPSLVLPMWKRVIDDVLESRESRLLLSTA